MNLGRKALMVRPENLAWEKSQNHLLSWEAMKRQILQWRRKTSKTVRHSDHIFCFTKNIMRLGRAEMGLEGDVYKEYMKIGIFHIIFYK